MKQSVFQGGSLPFQSVVDVRHLEGRKKYRIITVSSYTRLAYEGILFGQTVPHSMTPQAGLRLNPAYLHHGRSQLLISIICIVIINIFV